MGKLRASCLCGGIRLEVDPRQIEMINNCHCQWCRKVSGAAFGTMVQVRKEGLTWLQGKDLVMGYESSVGIFRAFCRVCGSRTPGRGGTDIVGVPAGLLDDPLELSRRSICGSIKKRTGTRFPATCHNAKAVVHRSFGHSCSAGLPRPTERFRRKLRLGPYLIVRLATQRRRRALLRQITVQRNSLQSGFCGHPA